MIFTIFEILANMADCFLMSRLMINWFEFRSKQYCFLKALLLFSLLMLVDCIASFPFQFGSELFIIISFNLIILLFSIAFLDGNLSEKIFVTILCYVLMYFVNMPILALLSKIADIPIREFSNNSHCIERILCLIMTKLLYFLVTQALLWIKRKQKYKFHKNEWFLIISVLFITLLMNFSIFYLISYDNIRDYVCIAIAIMITLLDGIVFTFVRKIHVASQDKLEKEQLSLQLQQLEQKYQEISILRHDFQNSIQCVQELIASANYEEALAYTENWKKRKINLIPSVVQTSSSVIDVVMNGKASEALTYGIEISLRMTAQIPKSLEFDMSVLLSNLLDNAIEASRKNPNNPQIITTISEVNGYYRIVIRNGIKDSVLQKNQELATEKSNPEAHGWGLRSVKGIVKKYDGMINLYEKNSMFFVDILLSKI